MTIRNPDPAPSSEEQTMHSWQQRPDDKPWGLPEPALLRLMRGARLRNEFRALARYAEHLTKGVDQGRPWQQAADTYLVDASDSDLAELASDAATVGIMAAPGHYNEMLVHEVGLPAEVLTDYVPCETWAWVLTNRIGQEFSHREKGTS